MKKRNRVAIALVLAIAVFIVADFAQAESEYIIDNGDPGTGSSGTWHVSGGPNPYGANSLYSNEGGYYYWYQSGLTGTHDVYLWWTYYDNRCTSVEVSIWDGSTTHIEYVNQLQNGGQWNKIGTYDFSGEGYVLVDSYGGCTVCADAAKFSELAPICDNGQGQWCSWSVGTWQPSGGPNYYGTQSEYSNEMGAYYGYQVAVPSAGNYELSLWWTFYHNRCTDVEVRIYDYSWNLLDIQYVNQLQDGGQWNKIGMYNLSLGAYVEIYSSGGCTTCADAVKLSPVGPDMYEPDNWPDGNVILPDQVQTHTIHEDGDVDWVDVYAMAGYTYTVETSNLSGSNPDTVLGVFEYPSGTLVEFDDDDGDGWASRITWVADYTGWYDVKVMSHGGGWGGYDDQGGGPAYCRYDITLEEQEPQSDYIIDNGDPDTGSWGTWHVSGGPNPYGANSLYSNEGAGYYWDEPGLTGTYDVYLWWTYYSNRCTSVEVYIWDGTSGHYEYVNQQQNGGQWNKIGTYDFSGYGYVEVYSYGGGCTVCADAVKFSEAMMICDNDTACSSGYGGTWKPSNGANYYGTQSEYSDENASYQFYLQVPSTGNYEVSLWWTYYFNRCTDVEVSIWDCCFPIDTQYVNQLQGGGQWNPIGTYLLGAGGVWVTVHSPGGCTTCADAVRLMPVNDDQFEPNNTLATATAFPVDERACLCNPYGYFGLCDSYCAIQGNDDWYEIFLYDGQDFHVECYFDHSNGDINIELYDGAGVLLDGSYSTTDNEYLSVDGLFPYWETFYIRVFGDNGQNLYDLSYLVD